jgi:outer membrane autotransporter protein
MSAAASSRLRTCARDALTLGAGVSAMMADDLALYAAYRAVLPTGNTTQHSLAAGLRWRF